MPWTDKARKSALEGRLRYCARVRYEKTHCENGHPILPRYTYCVEHEKGCSAPRMRRLAPSAWARRLEGRDDEE